MLYNVASSFVKIDETQGIIQNASSGNSIEVSDEATTDSGIILKPGESLSFTDTNLYVRTIGNKSSAVRVVPFVQGFSALSNSNSSSSEEFVASYTSILINSTTPEGKPKQELVSFVNPNKSKKELCTFGQMLTESTVNTYKNTYRIEKTLCDQLSSSAYDKYLIVDSPFTEDLTDNCSVVWNPTGTVTISDEAVQFNSSYLLSNEAVTFGGQDFTISLYAKLTGGSAWAGIFDILPVASQRPYEICMHGTERKNAITIDAYGGGGTAFYETNLSGCGFSGIWYHFEFDYCHGESNMKVFVDGILNQNLIASIERAARFIYLGFNTMGSRYLTGSMRNFKIWNGVALHTENFTLE